MSEPDNTFATAPDPDEVNSDELSLSIAERFEQAATARGVGADRHQDLWPDRLCQAVVDVLTVDGAAISVYLGGDVAVPVGANDLDASMGESLQFTVREGPCFESYRTRCPVLIANLRDPNSPAWAHWPIYASELSQHTAYHSVFAYPLMDSGLVLGSLSLYRRTSGHLQNLADTRVIAASIAERLAEELFWQAQGLTAQANRITPGQAIDLLRAQAYTADRRLDDVAEDIMSGRLPVPDLPSDS
jgi:hypothetical protein